MSEQNIIVIIESAENFYQLLNSHIPRFKGLNTTIGSFYDHYHAALHGCSCRKQNNLVAANEFYKQIKDIDNVIKEAMKKDLNAQKIIFFENKNNLLFEF